MRASCARIGSKLNCIGLIAYCFENLVMVVVTAVIKLSVVCHLVVNQCATFVIIILHTLNMILSPTYI